MCGSLELISDLLDYKYEYESKKEIREKLKNIL